MSRAQLGIEDIGGQCEVERCGERIRQAVESLPNSLLAGERLADPLPFLLGVGIRQPQRPRSSPADAMAHFRRGGLVIHARELVHAIGQDLPPQPIVTGRAVGHMEHSTETTGEALRSVVHGPLR
jgi:hypothetical protein